MTPTINKAKTGQQIRLLMEKRGVTVKDVKDALSLACVQSVYHWLDGQSMPTLALYPERSAEDTDGYAGLRKPAL